MNKNEYITSLNRLLGSLPADERNDIIYDYEEHFRMGMENGKTEEEIANALGDVRTIAKQFKADYSITVAQSNATPGNVFKAVLATLGLGFFNLVFVLGPFLGLVGVLIGFFSAAFGITIGGIAGVVATLISPVLPNLVTTDLNPFFGFFVSMGLTAFGLLFLIGDFYLAKYFFKGTAKYLKWNLDIIRKDGI